MATRYAPLNGNVVVRVVKEEKSAGGIVLPEASRGTRDRVLRGVVEATGYPRVTKHGATIESRVRRGDIVMFTKHADILEEDSGSTLYAVNDQEIITIIEEAAK